MEKEMAAHSSVLAWKIPGTGEPGGLLSMGSHRVGHDWSDLAAAARFMKNTLRFSSPPVGITLKPTLLKVLHYLAKNKELFINILARLQIYNYWTGSSYRSEGSMTDHCLLAEFFFFWGMRLFSLLVEHCNSLNYMFTM